MEKKRALKIRKKVKKKKPEFKRQENYVKKLKRAWRRPRGKRSKMRMKEKGRGAQPGVGYRSPKEVRGLNPQGFKEIMVSTKTEIEKINPENEIALIRATVGKRKRMELQKFSQEKGVNIVPKNK